MVRQYSLTAERVPAPAPAVAEPAVAEPAVKKALVI